MSAHEDGGLAFPGSRFEQLSETDKQHAAGRTHAEVHYGGLTARDWFDGQAIAGMLANGLGPNSPWIDHPPSAAEWAYSVADALIAERSK